MSTTRRQLGFLAAATAVAARAHDDEHEPPIARTAMIHGTANPLAVAGYRMGELALGRLGLERCSADLEVTHYCPASAQWSCIVDGLQASTGASLGKMNLRRVDAGEVYSLVKNKKTGQQLRFELTASFMKANSNLPASKIYPAGLEASTMKEAEVFRVR